MSIADSLNDVWESSPAKSKTPTFLDYLSQKGILAHRPYSTTHQHLQIEDLRPRNQDRVRILKRISAAPAGIALKTIVSETLKGQRVGQCERIDGSDKDYQFAYDFCTKLTNHVPPDFDTPLVRKRTESGSNFYAPRSSLIDLISEGIAQTAQENQTLYDRAFARDLLQNSSMLTTNQKEHLENVLENYVSRINDYCLLFDVHTYDDRGSSSKTMTKPYKTRFNDRGRIAKNFAQFNDGLENCLDKYQNAVLCTVTTDPGTTDDPTRPNPRSILETTESISPNFNRLNSWLKSDPSTARDTRNENVPQWKPELDPSNYNYLPDGIPKGGPPEGPVTSRPRKKLDYIKVLEFQENGLPHLHILFFDVPTREKDGMPWLVDKNELKNRWQQYGQGMIVDVWPLVKRDLTELDSEFKTDNQFGFVDWYRYGDHDRDDRWIQEKQQQHDRIDFTSDGTSQEKTAGAYLGKYLSVVLGGLLDTNAEVDVPDEKFEDKAATWKLAMYWATQSRFFTFSKNVQHAISPNEHVRESAKVSQTVRWASKDTISNLAYTEILNQKARQKISSLDDLDAAAQSAAEKAVTPNVESTLPESSTFGCQITYRGAYLKWDLPTEELSAPPLDDSTNQFAQANNLPPEPRTDRPPPIETVWN